MPKQMVPDRVGNDLRLLLRESESTIYSYTTGSDNVIAVAFLHMQEIHRWSQDAHVAFLNGYLRFRH